LTVSRLIASGCGCGHAKIAPGTIASAVTVLPGALLLNFVPEFLPAAVLIAALTGLWAIHAADVDDDPGWVVTHASLRGLLAAFLIFRLLDVAKPGPIRWANRQNGPAAIMADDLIAGAITAGILWSVSARWPIVLG